MEKYLYFGSASGADATGEAGMYPASRFLGVEPLTATTTGAVSYTHLTLPTTPYV